MSELRVTFSSDVFAQRVGGVSRYFGQLIRHLPEFGVTARASAGFHNNQYLRALPKGSVHGIVLPIKSARLAVHLASRMNVATNRIWEPRDGIYHPSYYTAPVPKVRLPTVLTIYDMIHERCPEFFDSSDETARLKSAWVSRADAVVAISRSTKRDAVELLGIDPSKITVVYPGIETPNEPASGWPERLGDVVLYVGHRGLYKNWCTLVGAMSRPNLRGMRLLCFGGGPARRSEVTLLRDLRMFERTDFVTGTDAELAWWYRRSSVLAYTSLYEGYGFPPLEAIAHQCPVVCGRNSSLEEMMIDLATMVDDPLNPEEFGGAIVAAAGARVEGGLTLPNCREAARRHADLYRGL